MAGRAVVLSWTLLIECSWKYPTTQYIQQESVVFVFSKMPDIFMVTKNFHMLDNESDNPRIIYCFVNCHRYSVIAVHRSRKNMKTILSAYSRRESILYRFFFTLLKPALPAVLPHSIFTVIPLSGRAEHPTSPEMPFTRRKNKLLSNSTVIFILMTARTDYWLTPGIKIFRTVFMGSAITFHPVREKAIPRSRVRKNRSLSKNLFEV